MEIMPEIRSSITDSLPTARSNETRETVRTVYRHRCYRASHLYFEVWIMRDYGQCVSFATEAGRALITYYDATLDSTLRNYVLRDHIYFEAHCENSGGCVKRELHRARPPVRHYTEAPILFFCLLPIGAPPRWPNNNALSCRALPCLIKLPTEN